MLTARSGEVVFLADQGRRLAAIVPAGLAELGSAPSGALDVEPVHAVDWLRIADLVSGWNGRSCL